MSKEELLTKLRECQSDDDTEGAHIDADQALLDFINDPEITEAYQAVEKWYE